MTTPDAIAPVASIVIPAHNEERVIGRLLCSLTTGVPDGHFDIVVVCNGCTDGTAAAARAVSDRINVIELTEPGKYQALRVGNDAAVAFPRLFVDADVEISASSVDHLVEALTSPEVSAVGPRRVIPREGAHWAVRSYYDVWESLPSVSSGLFGRGVIGFSEAGHERFVGLPDMMGDDLVISESFDETERLVVVDAEVTIHPPKTVGDLYRRRVRASTGNAQADAAGLRRSDGRTTVGDLAGVFRRNPRLAPRIPVFVAVVVAGRVAARRAVRAGDFETWERDETSRQ